MKPATISLVLIGLVCAAGVANAVGDPVKATVYKDTGCGALYPGCFLITYNTTAVVTPSGNSQLTCQFIVPDSCPPLHKAFKETGFECNTYLGVTVDSSFVANPGRQATLKCMVKAAAT